MPMPPPINKGSEAGDERRAPTRVDHDAVCPYRPAVTGLNGQSVIPPPDPIAGLAALDDAGCWIEPFDEHPVPFLLEQFPEGHIHDDRIAFAIPAMASVISEKRKAN
jgi:hypothetical protein